MKRSHGRYVSTLGQRRIFRSAFQYLENVGLFVVVHPNFEDDVMEHTKWFLLETFEGAIRPSSVGSGEVIR